MIACASAQLWPGVGLVAVALLVGPWVAARLREAELRAQFARHPSGGVTPSHVTLIRPAADAAEARLALAEANDRSPSAGPIHDQDTEAPTDRTGAGR